MPYSGDFLRSLFNSVSDGICFVDPQGMITHWNRGAVQLTGFQPRQVVGHCCWGDGPAEQAEKNLDGSIPDHAPLEHASPPPERAEADQTDSAGRVSTGPALVRLSLNRQRSFSIEARVRHRDGHWISVRASTLPVTDIAHRLSGVALILSPLEPPSAALTPLKDLRLLDLLYRYHRSNLTSEHSPTRT